MIYSEKLEEHLPIISKEDYYKSREVTSNIMDGPRSDTTKYACPNCLSTGKSPMNRKKECALCQGRGVVYV